MLSILLLTSVTIHRKLEKFVDCLHWSRKIYEDLNKHIDGESESWNKFIIQKSKSNLESWRPKDTKAQFK